MLYRAHIFSVSSLSISLSLVRRNFQRLTYSVWILNIPTWAIIPRNYSSQGFFYIFPHFLIHYATGHYTWLAPFILTMEVTNGRHPGIQSVQKSWKKGFQISWLIKDQTNHFFTLLWKFHHNFYLKPDGQASILYWLNWKYLESFFIYICCFFMLSSSAENGINFKCACLSVIKNTKDGKWSHVQLNMWRQHKNNCTMFPFLFNEYL